MYTSIQLRRERSQLTSWALMCGFHAPVEIYPQPVLELARNTLSTVYGTQRHHPARKCLPAKFHPPKAKESETRNQESGVDRRSRDGGSLEADVYCLSRDCFASL